MLSQRTNINPLILNYAKAEKMETISAEDYYVYYDASNQMTYYCGGGSSGQRSRSQSGWRRTDRKTQNGGSGTSFRTDNDAPYTTDD